MAKKYIDAELIEPFIKREEWDTPDERWRPESEFGLFIDAIPTADVAEVKRGRWLNCDDGSASYRCSVCGKHQYGNYAEIFIGEYHYCPNCGAKMDEVEE